MNTQSSYNDCIFRGPSQFNGTVERTVEELTPHADKFDTIAVRGSSGLLIAGPVALRLNKHITMVRKPGESSNASYLVEGAIEGRYIILDDIISTGVTVKEIQDKIHENHPGMKCVAIFLYHGFRYLEQGGIHSYRWAFSTFEQPEPALPAGTDEHSVGDQLTIEEAESAFNADLAVIAAPATTPDAFWDLAAADVAPLLLSPTARQPPTAFKREADRFLPQAAQSMATVVADEIQKRALELMRDQSGMYSADPAGLDAGCPTHPDILGGNKKVTGVNFLPENPVNVW